MPPDDPRGKRRARGEGELGEQSSAHGQGQRRDPAAGRPAPDGLPAVKSRTDGPARTLSTASRGQQAQAKRTDVLARVPLATRAWEEAGQEGLSREPRREEGEEATAAQTARHVLPPGGPSPSLRAPLP